MNSHTGVGLYATGRDKLVGHAAALLFAVLIAGSFSLGAKAAPHVGPAALNAIRFVLGAAVMAGIVLALHGWRWLKLPPAAWRFAVLGALFAFFFITMFVALKVSNPVSVGAVFTLTPIMSAGFGWLFLGHGTRTLVMASLVVAGLGAIWVIFGGSVEALASFQVGRGELIFLLGCACHAAYTPLTKKFRRGEPAPVFALYTLVGTAACLLLAGARELAHTDLLALPSIVWIAIAYLAVVTTAITTYLIQFAAMRLPAGKVMAYGYLTPSFIILLEGLSGQGWVPVSVGIGALITACALLIMALGPDL